MTENATLIERLREAIALLYAHGLITGRMRESARLRLERRAARLADVQHASPAMGDDDARRGRCRSPWSEGRP